MRVILPSFFFLPQLLLKPTEVELGLQVGVDPKLALIENYNRKSKEEEEEESLNLSGPALRAVPAINP